MGVGVVSVTFTDDQGSELSAVGCPARNASSCIVAFSTAGARITAETNSAYPSLRLWERGATMAIARTSCAC